MGAPAQNSSCIRQLELPVGTQALARALIGVELVCERAGVSTGGRIVETEAYVIADPASHAFRGPRPRNAAMFGPPFHAYVYRIYGLHWCFNITSEEEGVGAAVLVRALEPTIGIDLMRERRGCDDLRLLCSGPARLCEALAIDRSLEGIDLLAGGVLQLRPPARTGRIGRSRRIGITRAAHRLLRFYERGNPHLSGPAALSP